MRRPQLQHLIGSEGRNAAGRESSQLVQMSKLHMLARTRPFVMLLHAAGRLLWRASASRHVFSYPTHLLRTLKHSKQVLYSRTGKTMMGVLQEELLPTAHADDESGLPMRASAAPQKAHRRCSSGVLIGTCVGIVAFSALLLVAYSPQRPSSRTSGSVHSSWAAAPLPKAHGTAASSAAPAALRLASRKRCAAYLDRPVDDDFSLVLTADPGDFSGVSEAHYILENLVGRRDAPRDSTVCGGHSTGLLMGQPVLVVTTGIGPSAASLCTYEVLSQCGDWIREAIYFGTSGWSPQPGGVLNPPNCAAANWRENVTRTGDVCISPFSVNWTCKKSSWSKQAAAAPNQCSAPEEEAGPADTPLFGECMFYKDNILDNLQLADDLIAVARGAARSFPPRSSNVTAHELDYWGSMAEGAKRKLPALDPLSPPNVWDYNQCMEVDGQFFYNGSPWELKARDYAAATLGAAAGLLQAQLDYGAAGPLAATPASDMIAVSAMEGVGVSEALLRYHALSTTLRPVPFTNVRTLSNWMVQPIVQSKPGFWEVLREVPEDFVNGYAYAIGTGSATILSLYQDRCLAGERLGAAAAAPGGSCSFVIDVEGVASRLRAARRA